MTYKVTKCGDFDVFFFGDFSGDIVVRYSIKHLNGILPTDVLLEEDGSMVCKRIISPTYKWVPNGVCWGYNPLILGHPSTYQTPKLRSSY